MMTFISKLLTAALTLLVVAVAGVFIASMMPIPGNIEIKIVKSGSMEPSIPTGALVLIKPAAMYAGGDVITFGADTKTQVPTTHRIVAVAGEGAARTYTTKGDANEEADPQPVMHREVIGKVVLSVPYMGFVLDAARKPVGFALLIGLPALLIMIDELLTLVSEVKKLRRKRKEDHVPPPPAHKAFADVRVVVKRRAHDGIYARVQKQVVMSVAVFGLSLGFMMGHAGGTVSYFSDIERSINNFFGAGEWTDPNDPQNIVLNEFLPNPDDEANGLNFGDDADNMPFGEWIELYNNGSAPMNVAGWYMSDASGGGGNTHAVITGTNTNTGDTIIAPGGWLVVYLNKPTLNNTGDEIYLYTNTHVLVDAYSYDDPSDHCEFELTPGNQNNGNGSGTPGNGPGADCPQNQVAPNKSYARIPDGTGAFVDPVPTPGTYNIAEEPPAESFEPFVLSTEPPTSTPEQEVAAPTGESTEPTEAEDVPSETPPVEAPAEPVVQPIEAAPETTSEEVTPEEPASATEALPEEPQTAEEPPPAEALPEA